MTSLPIPPNYAGHVLVASPSAVVRQRVLKSLNSPAHRVEQASGGAEALVHLETGSWQVLFLDRRLPDLDAEELRQTIRQRFPGIEVVLLDPDGEAEPLPAGPIEGLIPEEWTALPNALPAHRDVAVHSVIDAPLPGMIGKLSHHAAGISRGAPAGTAQHDRSHPRANRER